MDKQTAGTVVATTKQWWLKVNRKALVPSFTVYSCNSRPQYGFGIWFTPSMGSYPFWILATTCFFRVYRGGRVYCELTISQF